MPRNTYGLDDWEWRLILRMRQMARDKVFGLAVIDLVARTIVEKINTHQERLDVPPDAALTPAANV